MKNLSIKDFSLHRIARVQRGPQEQGYRLSSDELNSGLDIGAVPLNTLPDDLVLELLRMRKAWGPAPGAVSDSRWMS